MTIIQGVTKKTGQERGSKDNKKVYGDDVVLFQIETINYLDYVKASINQIENDTGKLIQAMLPWVPFKEACEILIQEHASLEESLLDRKFVPFRPVKMALSGGTVTLLKYTGKGEGDPEAVYVRGKCLKREIIVPAPHGPIPPGKVVPHSQARKVMQALLPTGQIRQFKVWGEFLKTLRVLQPETSFVLPSDPLPSLSEAQLGI